MDLTVLDLGFVAAAVDCVFLEVIVFLVTVAVAVDVLDAGVGEDDVLKGSSESKESQPKSSSSSSSAPNEIDLSFEDSSERFLLISSSSSSVVKITGLFPDFLDVEEDGAGIVTVDVVVFVVESEGDFDEIEGDFDVSEGDFEVDVSDVVAVGLGFVYDDAE